MRNLVRVLTDKSKRAKHARTLVAKELLLLERYGQPVDSAADKEQYKREYKTLGTPVGNYSSAFS